MVGVLISGVLAVEGIADCLQHIIGRQCPDERTIVHIVPVAVKRIDIVQVVARTVIVIEF